MIWNAARIKEILGCELELFVWKWELLNLISHFSIFGLIVLAGVLTIGIILCLVRILENVRENRRMEQVSSVISGYIHSYTCSVRQTRSSSISFKRWRSSWYRYLNELCIHFEYITSNDLLIRSRPSYSFPLTSLYPSSKILTYRWDSFRYEINGKFEYISIWNSWKCSVSQRYGYNFKKCLDLVDLFLFFSLLKMMGVCLRKSSWSHRRSLKAARGGQFAVIDVC